MWSCGDQVIVRYRTAWRLSWVGAMTVVEDSAECIALYLAVETPIKEAVHLDGSSIPRAIPYEERWPLNAGWEQWRPDPSWLIPQLPMRLESEAPDRRIDSR